MDKTKIVVICGPTASGKSALALQLCRLNKGELIGADSMQIYQGLSVGTAAMAETQVQGVSFHLLGFLPPHAAYSVAMYVKDAAEAIAEISLRSKLPVVCGGTGLYLSSLLGGISFAEENPKSLLREELWQQYEAMGAQAMFDKLAALDPAYASKQHPNDVKRVLRALEINLETGETMHENAKRSRSHDAPYDALCLGLNFSSRERLYLRIEQRVDEMLANPLFLQEARQVYDNRACYTTAAQAIGYKEFFAYFEGTAILEECVAELKKATRHYAKRQLTWFRRMDAIEWLDAENPHLAEQAQTKIKRFLCA